MAEAWVAAAAITAGGALIGGIAKSKADKDARKQAGKDAKAANKDEAKWSSLVSAFEKEQDYRYEQMARQNKQRGLAEFRKFNTVNQFAPEYTQTNGDIVVPETKTMSDLETEYNASEAKNAPASSGGSGGKGSILDKIDPLGAVLGKKDPVRKALKKLF